MNLIDRACALHRRTWKPWIQPQAFHVHPNTAERMDMEYVYVRLTPWPPGSHRLERIKGLPVVRDPRVPEGAIALQFKNTTGWPLVT
jgi:hypothetical protein